MDLPKPPADVEAKNIIDKLAQFVARNGAEFEQMTKEKQQGNAKFAFLFGGEFFNYYQYRVTSEQAILKIKGNQHQQQEAPPPPSIEPQHPTENKPAVWLTNTPAPQPQNTVTVEQLTQQQSTLNEQIHQSESNLKAQHEVLKLQEDAKVDETIRKTQLASFTDEANSLSLSLETLDSMLQPIMDTCTKDSISSGKAWILQHAVDEKSNNFFSKYLLFKVLNASSFTNKLHIIYLVNDILHHCVRKNVPELKKAVEDVVVPMFCNVAKDTNDEQQAKLNKLLTLWESKNHYFSGDIVDKLKEPRRSWFEYRRTLLNTYSIVLTPTLALTKATYSNYQSQHEAFVQHAIAQIQTLEEQKTTLLQQKALATMMNVLPAAVNQNAVNSLPSFSNLVSQPQSQAEAQKPPDSLPPLPGGPPPSSAVFHQPPPTHFYPPTDLQLPDFSRPPPGFGPPNMMGPGGGAQGPAPPPPAEIQREELMPSLPYYDLPAGLMVPLIKLEDSNYKPLDRKKIRLPPPTPPSDRLIQAVKAFYAPPGHDSPRDSEGWEKLGLYEYYRAKSCAKRQKEEEIESGRRERTPPPSPVIREKTKSPTPPPRKRYSSRSRSRSKERERDRDTRSPPPPPPGRGGGGGDQNPPPPPRRNPGLATPLV
uniref:Calcium homeostasis endoplasmic reticulum protein n=1 Tax=Cacopsylla melanoneura TaxID=428564 RepID=A0A8D8RCX3_9HEMI